MAFREKSAWILSIALLVGGALYFGVIASMSAATPGLIPPSLPSVAVYTVLLVVVMALGHIAIAAHSPREANAEADERERLIFSRAGEVSGQIFGAGVVLSLGLYLLFDDGDLLFYCIFGSLMTAQILEYAWRIRLFRRGV